MEYRDWVATYQRQLAGGSIARMSQADQETLRRYYSNRVAWIMFFERKFCIQQAGYVCLPLRPVSEGDAPAEQSEKPVDAAASNTAREKDVNGEARVQQSTKLVEAATPGAAQVPEPETVESKDSGKVPAKRSGESVEAAAPKIPRMSGPEKETVSGAGQGSGPDPLASVAAGSMSRPFWLRAYCQYRIHGERPGKAGFR